jgi:hypothetical protein
MSQAARPMAEARPRGSPRRPALGQGGALAAQARLRLQAQRHKPVSSILRRGTGMPHELC